MTHRRTQRRLAAGQSAEGLKLPGISQGHCEHTVSYTSLQFQESRAHVLLCNVSPRSSAILRAALLPIRKIARLHEVVYIQCIMDHCTRASNDVRVKSMVRFNVQVQEVNNA